MKGALSPVLIATIFISLLHTTAQAQQAITCETASRRAPLAPPSTFLRTQAPVHARLSRVTPRLEALVGSIWAAETRDLSRDGLASLHSQLLAEYDSKYRAFCRHASVLNAMERPDALGYRSGTVLTCDALIADLDRLDPNDPMPGTRERSRLFRMVEYQALRTAMHQAAFVSNRILVNELELGMTRTHTPSVASLDAQLSAVKEYARLLTLRCRAQSADFRNTCATALTATNSFLARIQETLQEVCGHRLSDEPSSKRPLGSSADGE